MPRRTLQLAEEIRSLLISKSTPRSSRARSEISSIRLALVICSLASSRSSLCSLTRRWRYRSKNRRTRSLTALAFGPLKPSQFPAVASSLGFNTSRTYSARAWRCPYDVGTTHELIQHRDFACGFFKQQCSGLADAAGIVRQSSVWLKLPISSYLTLNR
jgi:hypothetical protein